MIKLNAIKTEKIWGYEDWKASTHPSGKQEELAKIVGGDYPLIVKVIQADKQLSVQVHPDDSVASLYEHSKGKTECWYILDADKDARLVYGLNGVYSDTEIRKAVQSNSIVDCLRYVTVEAGDFLYVPAGTVHSISGGIRLLEIQQASDITYRLWDWGRNRECHLEKALSSIKSENVRNVTRFQGVFSCPYFLIEEITVEDTFTTVIDKAKKEETPANYVVMFVVDGEGKINGEEANKEDTFVFAPGETVNAEGDLTLMKIVPNCR